MINIDFLIHSAGQVVTCASRSVNGKRGPAMQDVGIVPEGALAVDAGLIVEVGGTADLRARYAPRNELDAGGKVVCPGFVDPHTHLVFGGDRVDEFEMRIRGATYLEIMQAGGGIASTMRATRAASLEDLVRPAHARLDVLLRLGTTTVEIKSGYGLDTETELKILQAVRMLQQDHPLRLVPTFLGAHTVPPDFGGRTDAYVDLVVEEMTPAVVRWAKDAGFDVPVFCDVFCEANVFDRSQARRVLEAGLAAGLPAKIHADEFANLGGVSLAVELGAVSADHLDVTPAQEISLLAASQTVGVLLPAVNFNLGSSRFADARAMIDAGAVVALATDYNPGSAPCYAMPLVMAIACRYQRISPAEAINAATINAACALALGERIGSLEPGKQADFLLLATDDYRDLAYEFGANPVEKVFISGRQVV